MKIISLIVVTGVALWVMAGCNVVREAAPDGVEILQDAARAAVGILKNGARSVEGLGNEAASKLSNSEAGTIIKSWVDDYTPDQKEKLKDILISTTCWYLTSSFEGRLPTEKEWAQHISGIALGYYSKPLEEIYDVVTSYAEAASTNIQNSGVDQTAVRQYCNAFH